jgi:hypothetical protein
MTSLSLFFHEQADISTENGYTGQILIRREGRKQDPSNKMIAVLGPRRIGGPWGGGVPNIVQRDGKEPDSPHFRTNSQFWNKPPSSPGSPSLSSSLLHTESHSPALAHATVTASLCSSSEQSTFACFSPHSNQPCCQYFRDLCLTPGGLKPRDGYRDGDVYVLGSLSSN